MQHICKFDGVEYTIAQTSVVENGKTYSEDINIIWRDSPIGTEKAWDNDLPHREFINYYYGDYTPEDTDYYIKDWYKRKLIEKPKSKQIILDLPVAYVDMIEACLETIRDHDLLELVYGEFPDKISEMTTKDSLQEVLNCFCKPITDRDCDVKIIIED